MYTNIYVSMYVDYYVLKEKNINKYKFTSSCNYTIILEIHSCKTLVIFY